MHMSVGNSVGYPVGLLHRSTKTNKVEHTVYENKTARQAHVKHLRMIQNSVPLTCIYVQELTITFVVCVNI